MKVLLALSAVLLSTGCAIGTRTSAPTELASGAAIGMWTLRPADDVRACIDRVLAGTPSRFRYEVTANDTRKTYMTTTVSGFTDGNTDPAGVKIAAICLPER